MQSQTKTNILMVDDEPANLLVLEAILKDLGQNLIKARSGEEALRYLLNDDFAVILLDVRMPGMDGFETAELIRQRRKSYQTPIIFLTGMSQDSPQMFRGYEVGAVDYMVKPLVPEILKSKVSVFVELFKKNAEINRQKEQLRLAALRSEQRFYDLVQGLDAIVWEADAETQQFTFVSQRAETILGYSVEHWLHKRDFRQQLIHPDDLQAGLWQLEDGVDDYEMEYRAVSATGHIFWLRDKMMVVRDENGRVTQLRGVMVDISSHKETEKRLAYMAHYDALTGLPNRTLLEDRLKQVVAYTHRHGGSQAAVMFLDLDRFKFINDTMGHKAGDLLLQTVAQRLQSCVRETDTVARLSGDEFIIILAEVAHTSEAGAVAQKILDALAQPVTLEEGKQFFVTCSIGISIFPHDGTDTMALLKNADTAMYRVKEQGKNGYEFFTEAMNEDTQQRVGLENDLRRALERNEFELYYQPKVNVQTGQMVGMEALLRWQSPTRGLVMPDAFIPVLEETGMIVGVGAWVLRTACAQAKAWQEMRLPPMRIAVNLSARQFYQNDLLKSVADTLAETGLDTSCLELEVTESIVIRHESGGIDMLKKIRDMGVHLSVDDFGTGYSALSTLKRFPLSTVKIDRSFICDVDKHEDDQAIALAIIGMAHHLKFKVLAEGVETFAQLAFLRRHGCDEIQGELFSPALSVAQMTELLRENRTLQQNLL